MESILIEREKKCVYFYEIMNRPIRLWVGRYLTGSIDARWPNSRIVFALTQNLIQHLLLFFTKVNFGVVCTKNRRKVFCLAFASAKSIRNEREPAKNEK